MAKHSVAPAPGHSPTPSPHNIRSDHPPTKYCYKHGWDFTRTSPQCQFMANDPTFTPRMCAATSSTSVPGGNANLQRRRVPSPPHVCMHFSATSNSPLPPSLHFPFPPSPHRGRMPCGSDAFANDESFEMSEATPSVSMESVHYSGKPNPLHLPVPAESHDSVVVQIDAGTGNPPHVMGSRPTESV